jgi:hypothetical protein
LFAKGVPSNLLGSYWKYLEEKFFLEKPWETFNYGVMWAFSKNRCGWHFCFIAKLHLPNLAQKLLHSTSQLSTKRFSFKAKTLKCNMNSAHEPFQKRELYYNLNCGLDAVYHVKRAIMRPSTCKSWRKPQDCPL